MRGSPELIETLEGSAFAVLRDRPAFRDDYRRLLAKMKKS
jgi:hypothetical protein